LARILGEREFWGLRFWLSPATLVPRPDHRDGRARGARLGESPRSGSVAAPRLGTGTGCLLVALLHEVVEATGVGRDRLSRRVCTARRNAERNGVGGRAAFAVSDWAAPIQERFDLVVSNPPYIPSGEISGLDPEVRTHDPRLALDAGMTASARTRRVRRRGPPARPGRGARRGVGIGQEAGLRAAAEVTGLLMTGVEADLEGRARAAVLERS
jgi:release factor glutamine methyltransferase